MAKNCKCAICNTVFDIEKIQAVRHGARRYSHATCEPDNKDFVPLVKKDSPPKEIVILRDYIYNLFDKDPKLNWELIMKQIKNFINKGYTYGGIKKTLEYFYVIQKNPIDKANKNIAIVPYVYEEAKNYYANLNKIHKTNKDKSFKDIEIEIITDRPKRKNIFKKLFDIGE